MNKKKLKAGLESLFSESSALEAEQDTVSMVEEAELHVPQKVTRIKATRKHNKTFTSDLDSLLAEALSESFEEEKPSNQEQREQPEPLKEERPVRKRRPIALTGLDALIRRTVEVSYGDQMNHPDQTKRLTVRIKKTNLERLKEIARTERSYLKDILGELISEYIKKHEEENY